MPKFQKKIDWKVEKPEWPIAVKCDAHPWMHAYWLSMDQPYYAVTDADGNFKIADLPPGDYEVEVWQGELGKKTEKVTIKAEGGHEGRLGDEQVLTRESRPRAVLVALAVALLASGGARRRTAVPPRPTRPRKCLKNARTARNDLHARRDRALRRGRSRATSQNCFGREQRLRARTASATTSAAWTSPQVDAARAAGSPAAADQKVALRRPARSKADLQAARSAAKQKALKCKQQCAADAHARQASSAAQTFNDCLEQVRPLRRAHVMASMIVNCAAYAAGARSPTSRSTRRGSGRRSDGHFVWIGLHEPGRGRDASWCRPSSACTTWRSRTRTARTSARSSRSTATASSSCCGRRSWNAAKRNDRRAARPTSSSGRATWSRCATATPGRTPTCAGAASRRREHLAPRARLRPLRHHGLRRRQLLPGHRARRGPRRQARGGASSADSRRSATSPSASTS